MILDENKRPKYERLVLITFDAFLGRVEMEMSKEELERKKNETIKVRVKRPPISIKSMYWRGKHIVSRNVIVTEKPQKEPELLVYSGGSTGEETNSSIVSFAHPTPLNVLNTWPLPYMWIGKYASTITHELADSLLKECEDIEKCAKNGNSRNFGESCKIKLEELYL